MDKIAEVIEASTGEFTAQSYELHQAPPFGSLLRTGEEEAAIYGAVCYSSTASLEPGRRPTARGWDLEEEEEVYRQNPQLARLLRTEFRALIVGHQGAGRICHFLPPQPPRLHAFVYPCPQEEVASFTQSLDFLPLLLGAALSIPNEELVAACLRAAAAAREDGRAFLVRAGKELALLLARDPSRLNVILRKIRP